MSERPLRNVVCVGVVVVDDVLFSRRERKPRLLLLRLLQPPKPYQTNELRSRALLQHLLCRQFYMNKPNLECSVFKKTLTLVFLQTRLSYCSSCSSLSKLSDSVNFFL